MKSPTIELLASQDWVSMDQYLPESLAEELQRQSLELYSAGKFRSAGIGQGSVKKEIRSDEICWLNAGDSVFELINPWLDSLQSSLNKEFFLGLNSKEFHLARYAAGGHYDAHLDASSQHRSERVISMVYYLNKAPQGGELLLHLPDGPHAIQPKWNRLVLFRSKNVLHEVASSQKDRWSLTGWFLRKPSTLI